MLAVLSFAVDLLGSFADGESVMSSSDLDLGVGVCARLLVISPLVGIALPDAAW